MPCPRPAFSRIRLSCRLLPHRRKEPCHQGQFYSKPPFAGPRSVLSDLARYTHRIAISNHRLLSLRDGRVTFRWRDHANEDRTKTMTFEATEFLRRSLRHVVPGGFMRVRHYGLLANALHKVAFERCRILLGAEPVADAAPPDETWQALVERLTGRDPEKCPRCHVGQLVVCETLPAIRPVGEAPPGRAAP